MRGSALALLVTSAFQLKPSPADDLADPSRESCLEKKSESESESERRKREERALDQSEQQQQQLDQFLLLRSQIRIGRLNIRRDVAERSVDRMAGWLASLALRFWTGVL